MAGHRIFETFADTYRSVSGHPHIVPDAEAAARVILEVIAEVNPTCIALAQLPEALQAKVEEHCAAGGIRVLKDPFPAESVVNDLDGAQIGISGAVLGIAESGTLVEVATDDAHRLVSSLPRTYIGVLAGREMVDTFREGAGRLREVFDGMSRAFAVSFISGPSRTGDIELILTLGVHGPEVAHAIVITGEPDA